MAKSSTLVSGEIYRLRLIGTPVTFCSDHRLINELCDEKRFRKVPSGIMKELRSAANDGLITVRSHQTHNRPLLIRC